MNKKRLFYLETKYQFLVSLSIVVSPQIKQWEVNCNYSNIFIDATPDGFFYKNKKFIFESFKVIVQRVKYYSYYNRVLKSIWVSRRFRTDVNNTYFFLFSNRSPIANKISSYYKTSQTILVEEGLSLYRLKDNASFGYTSKRLFKELIISVISQCRYCDHFGQTEYAGSLMLRYKELYKKNHSLDTRKILELPDIDSLLLVQSKLKRLFDVPEYDWILNSNKKSMIFFGQPLSELGIVSFEDEIKIIQKLIIILNRLDINLIMKAHPNDKKDKYNSLDCNVIPQNIPAEVICFSRIPLVGVFSYYSTAAINVGASFGIPIFFLFKMLTSLGFDVSYPSNANITSLTEFDGHLEELLLDIE